MRSSRLVVLSLAAIGAAGLTPSAGAAQSTTQGFADSWYWGAYGGYTNFATAFGSENLRTNAPSIGADWMLTRTRFALNIFADQSYFSTTSSIASPTGAAPLAVNINDMRRLGFAVMIFTPEYKAFKPYFGIGYSFNFINSAALRTCAGCSSFPTQAAADSNQKAIVDARSMGKAFGNVGVMWIYKRFAPFVQYTVMPTQGTSDWYLNGTGFTTIWAIGLRYNFGSSIEKF
jgi:outer membrane protein W